MSNITKKRKTLTRQVITRLILTLLATNILVMACIATLVSSIMQTKEEQYMTEVIKRLSIELNYELNSYGLAAESLAHNSYLSNYLVTVEVLGKSMDKTSNTGLTQTFDFMRSVSGYDEAVSEMDAMVEVLGDSVLNIGLFSLYTDIGITSSGDEASFNLSNMDAYKAIDEMRCYVSSITLKPSTGEEVITVGYPVLSKNGVVTGLVAVNLSLAKVTNFVTNTSLGTTGTTYILDQNNSVIVHADANSLNLSVEDISIDDEDLVQELINPTGKIVEYTHNGVPRMGGIGLVETSGWKLVSAIDMWDFQRDVVTIVRVINVLQVTCLGLAILLVGKFIHSKLSPITRVQEFMHEISIGNLDSEIECTSEDEIGALVTDIQNMVANLVVYIEHIDNTMEDFGRGKIQVSDDVEYLGDFRPIYESMEKFVRLMSGSLTDLKRTVDEVGTGANQISSGAQVLASGAAEQAASVTDLNKLISLINNEITDTAEYSSKIAGYAGTITEEIQRNNEKMQHLAVSVQEIKNLSDEVKRIIKTIEDVAFQTNILALNAAVEAARAGQSGKGFAVVADEVRNLSLKTAEAVDDTTKIITNMTTFIEASTDLAQDTSQQLQHIVDEAESFVDNMANITHSTRDQSEAISEIHDGIEQISDVVGKTSAISEQSAAASEELTAQTTAMIELIQKFEI